MTNSCVSLCVSRTLRRGVNEVKERQHSFLSYSSLLHSRSILRRIHKLTDICSLLIQIGQMLCAKLLIHLELLLREVLLARSDICLAQSIVRVGKVGVQFQRASIFGNCCSKVSLVRAEVSHLEVSLGKGRISGDRSLQDRLNLFEVQIGILSPLPFP